MILEDLRAQFLNWLTKPRNDTTPSGLTLGRSTDEDRKVVVWPDRYRCEHLVITGKTGVGKTTLIEHLALQLASRGEGWALLDYHGDSSLSVLSKLVSLGLADRVVVLDPSHPTLSAGLNVLEAGDSETHRFRKVSELSSILRQRWGVDSFGARTEELLRNALFTLAAGGRTLADLRALLTDAVFRGEVTAVVEHPEIRSYWQDRYEPLSEPMKAAFREPLLNKVTAFLTEPGARHLLAQRRSTIDIDTVIREGAFLVVRLPKGQLREHAHTLGNLIFAQLQFAIMARENVAVGERRTFTLFCDEAQNLGENDLNTLINESRKYRASVVTAAQFWEQLPRELRGSLLSAGSHACFRVNSNDANVLAGELDLQGRHRLSVQLTALDRGEAIVRFGNGVPRRLRVPAPSRTDGFSREQLDALVARVSVPRHEIERGLRQQAPREPRTAPVQPGLVPNGGREGQHDW